MTPPLSGLMNCVILSFTSAGANETHFYAKASGESIEIFRAGLYSSFVIPHSLFVFREHVAEERALRELNVSLN